MWEITNISGQILNHDLNSQASEFVTMDKLVNTSRKLGDTLTTQTNHHTSIIPEQTLGMVIITF